MNKDADRFEKLLTRFINGECGPSERNELAQWCAADREHCQTVMQALSFSELLHQACVKKDDFEAGVQEELGLARAGAELHLERLLAGETVAADEDAAWVDNLAAQPGLSKQLRGELEFEELIAQAASATKSEEAFVQALSTRMWAEVEEDHFVEDLASKIIELDTTQTHRDNRIVSIALAGEAGNPPEQTNPAWWAFLPKPVLAAAAVVALSGIVLWNVLPGFEVGQLVAESGEVIWDAEFGETPGSDGGFGKGLYRLQSGVVYLRFPDGAEMSVEGPAEFEIKGKREVEVHSGLVVARDGLHDKQDFVFQARGLDLAGDGSTMGVDVRDGEAPELSVLSGGADIRLASGGERRRLRNFEAVRADLERDKLVDIPFNARPFSKAWELMAGVAANTGTVEVVVPGSQNRRVLGGNRVRVTVERDQFELPDNGQLEVDTLSKGRFVSLDANQAGEVLSEKGRLRSYLLELKPGENASPASTLEASMTFDYPVVGLIFSDDRLLDSNELLGGGNELLNKSIAKGQVLLSDDGRTVNLLLPNEGSHLALGSVRVLVALN